MLPDVWGALGYDLIASEIASAMQDGLEILVIEGPPGIGKSSLARGVGAMWEAAGGATVVAEGDLLHGDVAFYPLDFALAGLSSGWRSLGAPIVDATRAGERMVGTAGVITVTIQTLAKMRRKRRRARTMFLGDVEQSILFQLERLSRGRPMLLIADNLHWWDPASLEFVGRLRDSRMSDAFPFLAEMRLVAAQTIEPYQRVSHPDAHSALLAAASTRSFALGRVPREGFDEVLAQLGADPRPTTELADAVYVLSGGHLALARRCAIRIAEGEQDTFLAAASTDEFVRKLLTERVGTLGTLGTQAVATLQVAAVLGLTFRRDEVACASDSDAHETARLLRYCREQDLVDLSDDVGRFVHDLYRQHFLAVGEFDRTGVHDRLADCLRLLRPADYELRFHNALHAERRRDAAGLAVHAALARQREGQQWRELPTVILDAIAEANWLPIVERFEAAVDHINAYRPSDCLASLSGLPRGLPRSLLAEADYLRATCLMTNRSDQDRAEGRSLLESWAGYEDEEPELGIRLMQLHLYGMTLIPDKVPGRELEGRIRQALARRAGFDRAAEDALYTMDRCAGSLYEPDVALIRNREAVDHFAPDSKQTLVRRPVEYYRCLVNLASSSLANAHYQQAREVCGRIDRLVESYAPGVFPRLDYPATNRLVAELRDGAVDVDEAVNRQHETISQHRVDGDPFYAENALAVFLALAGRTEEALNIYDSLRLDLLRRRQPEPSMLYLISANRCAVRFTAGSVADVQAEWPGLDDLVRRIPYAIGRFLVRRHDLLGDVIAHGEALAPKAFDECLVIGGSSEFGPMWDQLGRGFRLPEIEWWR